MPYSPALRAVLMSQARPRRDEVPVLGRLEHVERFLVGERGVIDDANAVADALLDRARGAGVSGKRLVAELGFTHRHLHLLLRHRRFLGAHAGDLFAGEIELDGVDAILDEHPHRAAHLFRSGDDEAEIETLMGDVRGRGIPQASDRRDFRSGREITRSRNHAAVDRVAHDDVETRLCCGRAAPRGESGVEHEFGHLRRDERVLLRRHHLNGVDARSVVPGKMEVRVAQARHQGRAHPVDDRLAAACAQPRRQTRRASGDLPDSISLDGDLPGVRVLARAVDDAHVGENDAVRSAESVISHGPAPSSPALVQA